MSQLLKWARTSERISFPVATNNTVFLESVDTLADTLTEDVAFPWVKCSSSMASTVKYVVFKNKNGAPGRFLVFTNTAAVTPLNPSLFTSAPTTNRIWACFFPSATTDTPNTFTGENAVFDDDSNTTLAFGGDTASTMTIAGSSLYFVGNEETMSVLTFGAASAQIRGMMAGNILEDIETGEPVLGALCSSSFNLIGNSYPNYVTALSANGGSGGSACYTVGSGGRQDLFAPLSPLTWHSTAQANDIIMYDAINSRAYFLPILLSTYTLGLDIRYKLRQLAVGPQNSGANQTLGDPADFTAMSLNTAVSGVSSWLLNTQV